MLDICRQRTEERGITARCTFTKVISTLCLFHRLSTGHLPLGVSIHHEPEQDVTSLVTAPDFTPVDIW